jgi:nitroreductase/NAD-dependent dihydropyrimidine dehydrogenase PreA subunit
MIQLAHGEINPMGLLKIDKNSCKKDALCVRECPTVIIHLGANGFPEIIAGGEAACLGCGHCVAVCPYGALSHARITIQSSPAIKDELRIDENQAAQFLRSRRSIRYFQDKPVEKGKIQRLIEIARYAPTGGNSQMVEWLVLSDKMQIREIAGLVVDWLRQVVKNPQIVAASPYLPLAVAAWDAGSDSILRGAPTLVIAMAPPAAAMTGMVDLTLALSYLDLFAPAMGLGTCWAGLLQGALVNSPSVKKAVGIPENYPHHYPLMLGYPDVKFYRLPERKTPKITFA